MPLPSPDHTHLIPRKPVLPVLSNLIEVESMENIDTKLETSYLHSVKHKKKMTRRFNKIANQYWLWEALACLFNLSCLAAIVTVLHRENNRLLDDWSLIIPPTALLSFVSTLTKSSLLLVVAQVLSQLKWLHYTDPSQPLRHFSLYDSATRGPLGSLLLLFSSRKFLTIAAALITILALLIDPFVQLVFQFQSELSVDVTIQPTFRQIIGFDPNRPDVRPTFGREGDIINSDFPASSMGSIRGDIVRSMIQGFEDGDIDIAVDCATGNCTWSNPISTLGICGSCEDVTTQLKIDTFVVPDTQTTIYNITFQSGLWAGVVLAASSFVRFNATATSPMHYGLENLGSNSTGNLVAFAAIQLPATDSNGALDIDSSRGWQCEMHYCQKTFNQIAVNLGKTSVSQPIETLLTRCPKNVNLPNEFLSTELRPLAKDCGTQETLSSPAYYTNDTAYTFGLPSLLGALFTTDWTHGAATLDPPLTTDSASEQSYRNYLRSTGLNMFFPPVAVILGNAPNLDVAIKKLATSMTEAIRLGTNSSIAAGGAALVPRTTIRVRWWPLALPFALILISPFLLAATAIRTSSAKIPAWKNDALAMIMHHLSGFDYGKIPHNAEIEDLEDIAEEVHIRLQPGHPMVFARVASLSEDVAKRVPYWEPVSAVPSPAEYERKSSGHISSRSLYSDD